MKLYLKHYIWFWKESFSFMQGHNKLYITWGCLINAHGFAKNMVKWDRLTSEEREYWYLHSDRTIEF